MASCLPAVSAPLVPEGTSEAIETFLPKAFPRGGRPRVSDREALDGIMFVVPWRLLSKELDRGSG